MTKSPKLVSNLIRHGWRWRPARLIPALVLLSTLMVVGSGAPRLAAADASIALLRKSLERNGTYGSARMFLIAALSLSGQYREAAEAAASFRQQYPDGPAGACEQLWLSRSRSATYRAQILPVFETIRNLGVGT